jgi:hypothetical protein
MSKKNNTLRVFFVVLFTCVVSFAGMAQGSHLERNCTISWYPLQVIKPGDQPGSAILSFKGSSLSPETGMLPVFRQSFPFDPDREIAGQVTVINQVFEPCNEQELARVIGLDKITPDIVTGQELTVVRKHPSLTVSLVPLRKDPATGLTERLVSFTLVLEVVDHQVIPAVKAATGYASNSVLATGNWYKFAVGSNGIYRLSYDDLKSAGMDVANIDPRKLRVYGNGGGMLPEANSTARIDDLRENSIYVYGEEDGKFDPGDYLLFYGQSPDQWVYTKADKLFHHRKNIYSDKMYYFLNVDLGFGKRIGSESSTSEPATYNVTRFEDFAFYEKDDVNLIKSGREWLDKQTFDMTTDREYSFSFPNIDNLRPVTLTADLVARSTSGSTAFVVSAQGTSLTTVYIPAISGSFEDFYAKRNSATTTFTTANPAITLKLTFNRSSASAVGYLNYLELNAMRLLAMSGSQMSFRTAAGTALNNVSEFTLNGNGQTLQIWDVTDGGDIRVIETTLNGGNYSFRLATDTLREFIAFDGTTFSTPEFTGKIENQDLHGTPVADYLIVCHPSFLDQAERLAGFHTANSNLSVFITTPEKIYNEFSSGAQDITAIRDYVRMMYNKAEPGKEPKYLLLFGDASYDFKNRIQKNTNYVPAFEAVESFSPSDSYVSDDYFGMLDPGEGQSAVGELDLGLGRFPVDSPDQAREAVDKVLQYCSNSDTVKNDWRNVVTFVSDDQNDGGNLFINYSEDLANAVETSYKNYNVDKIYSDAYDMESTPGGARYPEVNAVITKRVEKGSLIMNYIGHGGEVGWAHERILEVPDIKSWQNLANLPVFVTATCEFSRFDDPERVSAGEWVFLNGQGGGIALFTTTRLTYASTNQALLVNFYNDVFKKTSGSYMRLGDLLMASKHGMSNSANIHAFVLLGDPAMQMAYPDLNVVTTSINGQPHTFTPDTLNALAEVTISGEVRDASGHTATNFSGTVFPTVFDKASEVWTKANQGPGDAVQFFLRKNPVYKGKVNVVNGKFTYSFIVPRDIAINYGPGKISYYARSPETDANGYDELIQVGGYNNKAESDTQGPEVALFMNDHNFISGGMTDQNPVLLADVSDSSGVNTVGNGIGHDITAVLDEKTTNPMILNDYYVSDLNTFKSGEISYPLSDLADGPHQIKVKVWDVYNNSTDAIIDFVVASSAGFSVRNLMTYPNPMYDHTTFSWESNQVNLPVDIEIGIFTLNGTMVKNLKQTIYAGSYHTETIQWDGTQDDGRKISTGLYVYRVKLVLPDGSSERLSSKLVVIR